MFGEAAEGHGVQGRTGDHQRNDGSGRRQEEHDRLRPRPQGTADRGTASRRRRNRAPSPISVLKTFIENENIKFQELNLFEVGAIPAEMKTIMISVRNTISPIAR